MSETPPPPPPPPYGAAGPPPPPRGPAHPPAPLVSCPLLHPQIPPAPGAAAVPATPPDMVADAPTLDELLTIVLPEQGISLDGDVCLIAHNVKFDRRFYDPIFNVTHTFCSLALARQRYPNFPNHKLGTVKEQLGLVGGPAHRALGDVYTVHQFLLAALPATGRSLAQHCVTPLRTVFTMPFGEHKGKPLASLPREYRTWLLSVDIDPDLRHSLMQLRKAEL